MEIHTPVPLGLSCPTCRLPLENDVVQKLHYKSDLHRYNLKRKMVGLPAATQEQFSTKRIHVAEKQVEAYTCNECKKNFGSENTFNQHVASKGHDPNKEMLPAKPKGAAKQQAKLDQLNCLFCLQRADTLQANEKHMEIRHGFFVPEKEYCINVVGLLEYLHEKIEVGMVCLKCQNKKTKDFASGSALRMHMTKKRHCNINTDEGYAEYEQFYDFSPKFKDILEDQKERTVAGITYKEVQVIDDHPEADNDDQWQDEEEEDSDDSNWEEVEGEDDEDDEDDEEQEQNKAISEKRQAKIKKYNIMVATPTNTGELLLPNGKTLGHRQYRYLYRQTYRQRVKPAKKAIMYHNNELIARKDLISVFKKREPQMKALQREQNRVQLRTNMRSNSLMEFFRCSTPL